jgi:hypothetical protein
MLEEGFFFFIIFQSLQDLLSFSQNKKRKDDQDGIAFLLSLDLRDYPAPGSGFVPFGVPLSPSTALRADGSFPGLN